MPVSHYETLARAATAQWLAYVDVLAQMERAEPVSRDPEALHDLAVALAGPGATCTSEDML